MAGRAERGAGPERPAHRQPRPRAGARDRQTAAGPGTAAAGRAEPLPDGVPALPRRLRAAGAPAGAVPRRSAMAGYGDARPARASGDAFRGAAPAAGRRLSGQRGRPRASAAAHARGDPQRRRAGPGHRAGARSGSTMSAGSSPMPCIARRRARGPLAQLVQEKTGGNPFFAIQFFTALAEEGLLAFDPVAPAWQWDIARIRAKNYTDNVVDLMAGQAEAAVRRHPGSPATTRLPGQYRGDRHPGPGARGNRGGDCMPHCGRPSMPGSSSAGRRLQIPARPDPAGGLFADSRGRAVPRSICTSAACCWRA